MNAPCIVLTESDLPAVLAAVIAAPELGELGKIEPPAQRPARPAPGLPFLKVDQETILMFRYTFHGSILFTGKDFAALHRPKTA